MSATDSVCHLDVQAGGVDAMVVGSDLYHVVVRIRKLGQVAWKAIRAECAGRADPSSSCSRDGCPITSCASSPIPPAACSCPDWAVMCKHAAAVLYGVGSRLDDRPELLFRLRDVDAEDLVVGDMALPDAAAGDDVLAGDLADIFGIDLDPADSGAAAARQRTTRTPRAPPREAASDRRPGVRVPAYGSPGGGAAPPGRILGPRVRRPAPRIRVDGVPLGSGPRTARPSEPVRRTPCRCCTGKSRNARLSDPARGRSAVADAPSAPSRRNKPSDRSSSVPPQVTAAERRAAG